MSESTSSIPFTPTHQFRLTLRSRWRFRILGTMLLGVSIFMLYISIDMLPVLALLFTWFAAIPFIAFPILFFAMGCMHWYNAERMHITFATNDFHIHACGYTLICLWSNVSRMGNRWGEECLFLDQPAETFGPLSWLPRLYQLDRFIFLNLWGQWWGSSQFAQDLRQAIPQIVEAPNSHHE